MNSEIRKTLEAVKSGELSVDDALLAIKKEPFEDIGYAKVDLHRGIRQGAAEVIYGAGKTPEQMVGIIGAMLEHEVKTILLTRLSEEKAAEIRKTYPQICFCTLKNEKCNPAFIFQCSFRIRSSSAYKEKS